MRMARDVRHLLALRPRSRPCRDRRSRNGRCLRGRRIKGFCRSRPESTSCCSIGRAENCRRDKRGAIPEDLAPILDRLGVDRSNWVDTVRDFGRMFKQAAGRASSLVQAAPRCSRRWFQGKAAAQVAFL